MRSISISAERQKDVEIIFSGETARVYIRRGAEQKETEEGAHWACEEATADLPAEDAPTVEEITEDLDDWFEFAAAWKVPRIRSRAQLQADVEYIAALTGIDLEV